MSDSDSLLDLEPSPFLRRQKQVEVRRGRFKGKSAARLKRLAFVLAAVVLLAFAGHRTLLFGLHNSRFVLSENSIEVAGINYVGRQQVVERFAGDVGRSVFTVPLDERRKMLEDISWVESAWVARAWPDRVRVQVRERTAVAFFRTSHGLLLVDANGVVMDRPARADFSFPVMSGLADSDTPEERRQRMQLYLSLVQDLDRDGAHHTLDVSEVDVSDPEDARVVVATRDAPDAILVHLGSRDFQARYRTYLAHIQQWRQQFQKVHSVDLRYERQIVVNPDPRP